jgi:outer membrane PBP1 activator LpoA protein
MLPLRSDALGAPAGALRAGFMAAYERDQAGFTVNLIETGDGADETLVAYSAALEQNDIVVGPLARSAVSALASSALVRKPTIALNHPEARARPIALPPQMLVIGLSIEDEARQVANWAGAEHPGGMAMIVSGSSAWQRRIAASFAARWKQLGQASQTVVLQPDANGNLSTASLSQLRGQVDAEQPSLLFTALDANQVGQIRGALGPDLPCYGTSSVNPGTDAGTAIAELDGLRLIDLPWEVQPAHQAVMVYPRWSGGARTLDMDRLYALGIDAFRVAREITLRPGTDFQLDGVTGRLSVSFGNAAARFERIQPAAVYQGGVFAPVPEIR